MYSDIDKSDMFKSIFDFPDHIKDSFTIGENISLNRKYIEIKNIVIAGMGGSAIGGDIVRLLADHLIKIPLVVSRNYSLPNWVSEDTLVICSSYSGKTEETLSAFNHAQRKKAKIIAISTGGTLSEKIKDSSCDLIAIPPGLQPRAAIAYSFIPLIFLLAKIEIIDSNIINLIKNSIFEIEKIRHSYSLDSEENPTFSLAKNIYNTFPIIYAEDNTTSIVATRWRGQLSENSKMLSFSSSLPEMNHNEIVGWENNSELLRNISIIWLVDNENYKRNLLRQVETNKIISSLSKNEFFINMDGKSKIERNLKLIHFGDWLSFWCAILHKTDPTPVLKIDQLKSKLSKSN